jgi:hypothetical protein
VCLSGSGFGEFRTYRFAKLRDKVVSQLMVASVIYALSSIARWPDGAQAVVTAGTLDTVYELIESPNSQVRRLTCELLGNLAHHRSTAGAVMGVYLCARLVSFLGCVLPS